MLNTWKGEQWTSCQNINSVLLNLVALFHNEPLLNEPGVKSTHKDIKPYNSIIQYKNYETAILGVLIQKILPKDFVGFFPIIKRHISAHRNIIISELDALKDSKNNLECKTSMYNMSSKLEYSDLKDRMILAFEKYL